MHGGRKTHDFPNGTPFAISLFYVGFLIIGLCWVFFAKTSWLVGGSIFAAFMALGIVYSRVLAAYERAGIAVRLPEKQEPSAHIGPTPCPIRAIHYAFFVLVAVMLVFGFAPLPLAAARQGIIASVVGLFVLTFLHFVFHLRYIPSGPTEPTAEPARSQSKNPSN